MQTSTYDFLLSLLINNEELFKFPNEFVSASTKWIRSWLEKNDPIVAAVMISTSNHELKAKVLEAKLPQLMEDQQFVKELGRRMADYESMKNVIYKNNDGRPLKNTTYNMNHSGSGNNIGGNQIVTNNNYYSSKEANSGDSTNSNNSQPAKNAKLDTISTKSEINKLIAKGQIEQAIMLLVDHLESTNSLMFSDALTISGRFYALRNKIHRGVLSNSDASIEQNGIVSAVVDLLKIL